MILGALFSSIQAYEYVHAPFPFKGINYGASFFMATGFHGFHVLIGTIFLIVCLVRAYRGDFTPRQHFGFEAAAWYWHFVDVVWLFPVRHRLRLGRLGRPRPRRLSDYQLIFGRHSGGYHPGEGRGPIGRAAVTKRCPQLAASPDWAPAFAGVVAVLDAERTRTNRRSLTVPSRESGSPVWVPPLRGDKDGER